MKQGGGKRKGGAYEREICEVLSLWVSEGNDRDLFWRSAGSGSRATNRKSKGLQSNQTGDITSVDPRGTSLTSKFFIECKHYKNLQLDSLIYGTPKNNNILEFWAKVKEDSNFFGKRPIIIARQNSKKDLIGIDYVTKKALDDYHYSLPPVASFPLRFLHLYILEDFLQVVDPVVFINFEIGPTGNHG